MPITADFLKKVLDKSLDFILPRSRNSKLIEEKGLEILSSAKACGNLPGIISLFDYKNPIIRTFIWEIKFRGNKKLISLAAQSLYEVLLAESEDNHLFKGGKKISILPVPLAAKRLRNRGFNQSERITQEILRMDGNRNFSLVNPVIRTKETRSQTQTASRKERIENMRGAFSLNGKTEVKGAHFVIIDDVATTGSTINEIKSVLMKEGAASAIGLTLAH